LSIHVGKSGCIRDGTTSDVAPTGILSRSKTRARGTKLTSSSRISRLERLVSKAAEIRVARKSTDDPKGRTNRTTTPGCDAASDSSSQTGHATLVRGGGTGRRAHLELAEDGRDRSADCKRRAVIAIGRHGEIVHTRRTRFIGFLVGGEEVSAHDGAHLEMLGILTSRQTANQ
jgi:hypothetical protein